MLRRIVVIELNDEVIFVEFGQVLGIFFLLASCFPLCLLFFDLGLEFFLFDLHLLVTLLDSGFFLLLSSCHQVVGCLDSVTSLLDVGGSGLHCKKQPSVEFTECDGEFIDFFFVDAFEVGLDEFEFLVLLIVLFFGTNGPVVADFGEEVLVDVELSLLPE